MRLRLTLVVVAVLIASAIVVACSVSGDSRTDDGNLTTITADEIIDTLVYGETSAPVIYTATPRYRAFAFTGNASDNVDILVHTDGQAMSWLEAPNGSNVAYDFASAHDAHIAATLPASGTYLIAFRDAALSTATFTVTLNLAPVFDGGVDSGIGDAAIDSFFDGGSSDSSAGDATSAVTCTFSITLPALNGCDTCALPEAGTLSQSNVPILIDDAGFGVPDFQNADAGARVLHIQSPTIFQAFGCPSGSALRLEGAPPNESWTETPSSWTNSFVFACPGTHTITPSVLPTSTTVSNGDQVSVELHYEFGPYDGNGCGALYGCIQYSLDCSGLATATVH